MLRLEAHGTAAGEGGAMLTFVAVCPVVRIELHAWFGGVDLHRAATDRLGDACGEAQLALLLLVEHEAVVVACAVACLLVVGIDVLSHRLGLAEVKRRVFDKPYLACRDGRLVNGQIEVCVYLAYLVVYCRGGIGNACQ